MYDIIDDLEADHRRFRRYLVWLSDEIGALGKGGDVDYYLLRMLARYFCEYPDELHHKKEDIIYGALAGKLRHARIPLANLHAEHEALSIRATRFREIVRGIINEQELPRGLVVVEAREYASLLGGHMKSEETSLFTPARKNLSGADWDSVHDAIADMYAEQINFDKAHSVQDLERSIDAYADDAALGR